MMSVFQQIFARHPAAFGVIRANVMERFFMKKRAADHYNGNLLFLEPADDFQLFFVRAEPDQP